MENGCKEGKEIKVETEELRLAYLVLPRWGRNQSTI